MYMRPLYAELEHPTSRQPEKEPDPAALSAGAQDFVDKPVAHGLRRFPEGSM